MSRPSYTRKLLNDIRKRARSNEGRQIEYGLIQDVLQLCDEVERHIQTFRVTRRYEVEADSVDAAERLACLNFVEPIETTVEEI